MEDRKAMDNLCRTFRGKAARLLRLAVVLVLIASLSRGALAAPGDLDTDFNTDGIALVGFPAADNDAAQAVLVQPDGKILLVGSATNASGITEFAAARLTPGGGPDSTFDGDGDSDGKVSYPVGSLADSAYAAALQPDGRIVLAGTTQTATTTELAVMRLTANGALDDTFSGDGILTLDTGALTAVGGAAVDSQGRIVVVGSSGPDVYVARFTTSGSLDSTFNLTGQRVIDFKNGGNTDAGQAVLLDGSAILVAGFTNYSGASDDFMLVRLLEDGSLDSTFGSNTDGQQAYDFDNNSEDLAYAAALDASSGLVYLAGYTDVGGNPRQFAAIRVAAADGDQDLTFGSTGWWVDALGSLGAEAYGIGLLPGGGVVVGGWSNLSGTSEDFSVARLTSAGALDTGFYTNGYRHVDIRQETLTSPGSQDQAYALAVQPDGRVLLAGESDPASGDFQFTVLRMETNNLPVVGVVAVGLNEDSSHTFSLAEFEGAYSDADSQPLASIFIQTLPISGTLTLNGDTLTAGQAIPPAAIATLVYTPGADFAGSDSFDWNASDGLDLAAANAAVDLTVNAVNDAPSFTSAGDVQALEDSGPQQVSGWASAISAGPADESGQALTFTVTADDLSLFSTPPAVDVTTGDLTFTPAAQAFGQSLVTVVLSDDGGTALGGSDSITDTLTISIQPVNDAPSFVPGGNVTVDEDSGPVTVSGWATAILAGPPNESGQMVSFHISVLTPTLFSAGPDVDEVSGDLSFTPAADANGSTLVSLYLMDNGGQVNGGVNASPTEVFTVTINAVNDLPVLTGITAETQQGSDLVFTAADFGGAYQDLEGSPIAEVMITTLPGHGSLLLDGAPVSANQVIPVAELDLLVYRPEGVYYGPDSFGWNASDGLDYAAEAAFVQIQVLPLGQVFLPVMRTAP